MAVSSFCPAKRHFEADCPFFQEEKALNWPFSYTNIKQASAYSWQVL